MNEVEFFIKVRSFLAGNIETILENLVARRESSKIDSEDLFAEGNIENKSTIQWQKNPTILKRLDVLLAEKESLGLYVSGNPLNEYQSLLHKVREVAGRDDIYLIIIEKVKKIFTRAGTMMFALEICLAEQDVEGIIFPKNAMRLSGKLEEKELFWVKGNIVDRSKNKTKEGVNKIESEETENNENDGVQEYAELPKLAIEDLCPFNQGVLPLFFNEDIKMAGNRISILEKVNWSKLKFNPNIDWNSFTDIKDKSSVDQYQNFTSNNKVKILKIPNNIGKDKLVTIKKLTSSNFTEGASLYRFEIQDSAGVWQKVKGEYWLDISTLPLDLSQLLDFS